MGLSYVWSGMHDWAVVVRNVESVEVVVGMFSEVELLTSVNVFALDVDEYVTIRTTYFIEKSQRRRNRVDQSLALQSQHHQVTSPARWISQTQGNPLLRRWLKSLNHPWKYSRHLKLFTAKPSDHCYSNNNKFLQLTLREGRACNDEKHCDTMEALTNKKQFCPR